MGWLRLVGSLKIIGLFCKQVSFAEYRLFDRAIVQMRPRILRSLLIVATPYLVALLLRTKAASWRGVSYYWFVKRISDFWDMHQRIEIPISSNTTLNALNAINVTEIPLEVTFSKALSKLKARSSNVSFHWNVAKETLDLWAFSLKQHSKTWPHVGYAVASENRVTKIPRMAATSWTGACYYLWVARFSDFGDAKLWGYLLVLFLRMEAASWKGVCYYWLVQGGEDS